MSVGKVAVMLFAFIGFVSVIYLMATGMTVNTPDDGYYANTSIVANSTVLSTQLTASLPSMLIPLILVFVIIFMWAAYSWLKKW
jgi:hypothetical protein